MTDSGRGFARPLRIAFSLIAVTASLGSARGDDETTADRWVARDAVMYLELAKPTTLIERANDERIRALLNLVPGYRDKLAKVFQGEAGRKYQAGVAAFEQKVGMPWDKALTALFGGGAVAALEARAKGEPPRAFVIVTPTDPSTPKRVLDALIDLVRQDAVAKGTPDPIKSIEHRGVTGYAVGPKATLAIVKGRVVFADQAETLKLVIDRATDGLPGSKSIAADEVFRARKAEVKPEALAWGLARVDRLRELDPKRYKGPEKTDTGQVLLFGGWLDTMRRASWASASLTWTDSTLAADLTVSAPSKGRAAGYQGFVPPKGSGAPVPVKLPGTVLTMSLWRELSALWEARADLLGPEEVQQLAGLDTFAGQFFGGRDFGTGVLGALKPEWRLVVALQDYKAMTPAPDLKVPAFALVLDLKPDDPEFAQRLKVAFQSFIGIVNLNAAQTKAPPLELGSETCDGLTIATSRFAAPTVAKGADSDANEPVHQRYNYSPSAVQVGDHFVVSSSVSLARDLVKALKAPAGKPEDATLVAEADGPTLGTLVDLNRTRLVMQNMLEKGNDKGQAESEIDLLAALLRYLGHGSASVQDDPEATRVRVEFTLGKPSIPRESGK